MKKVLAFDIGGTNTRLALINENFEIEKRLDTPTVIGSKEKFLENIFSMLDQFPLEDVVGIGAGVPGVVDKETGRIIDLPNAEIKDIEFGKIIKEKYNLPLFLRNDAEVACLGEAYLGAGKGYDRVFFITISTGLGGALCVDQRVQDYVTEVGHTLFNYKGEMREFEKTISGINVSDFAKKLGYDIANAKELFDGVRKGDANCAIVYKEWFSVLDQFVKLMINSYRPDIICMTGGVMKSQDVFFNKLVENNPEVIIRECHFSEGAGLMGSAVYAFQGAKII